MRIKANIFDEAIEEEANKFDASFVLLEENLINIKMFWRLFSSAYFHIETLREIGNAVLNEIKVAVRNKAGAIRRNLKCNALRGEREKVDVRDDGLNAGRSEDAFCVASRDHFEDDERLLGDV